MTDKKFTDEEIIETLECCAYSDGCERCQCSKQCDGAEHLINALDLINRQKSEIEELNIQLRELWNMASLYKAESEIWEGYNENLLTANTVLSNEILDAKAKAKVEAYEEFAEKLQAFCKGIIAQKWNEKAAPISWSYAYADFIDDIDNLLKEMVGEEE